MKRRYKILGGVLGFFAVALAAFALVASHNSSCPAPPPAPSGSAMNAVQYHCYGGPEVLKLEQVAKPVPGDDQLLVKVHAAGVNPLDWHYMRGEPYIMRMESGFGAPNAPQMGVDFSGTVEAVGAKVTRFKPGDEVFGGRNGAFAEYLLVRESRAVVRKPANVSHQDAAAIPIAAITALQALRDQGGLEAGQKVLINGASGGVGTYAVQLAKNMGAHVTGVCSTPNVELVQSLGADRVIDYKNEDFTVGDEQYDVVIDSIGNRDLNEVRRVMQPNGVYVMVGAPSDDPWIGGMKKAIKAMVYGPFVEQELKFFLADLNQKDLGELAALMESGILRSVIDRRYPLAEVPAAVAYVEDGHARGKVVIAIL